MAEEKNKNQKKIRIVHERAKCIGCGSCVALCPKQWEMAEDGLATLINAVKNGQAGNYQSEVDKAGCSQEAADSCPVQIIHIIEQ